MLISECRRIHELAANRSFAEAGNAIVKLLGKDEKPLTESQGLAICRNLFQYLLDNEEYLQAATLQWGPNIFQSEPESVKRSFLCVQENNLSLVMGGSSLGKTYGIGAWMLLDYLRDPWFTSVKLAAVSEKHLSENLYPHVINLLRNLAIPSEHKIEIIESDLWAGIKEAGYEFGISGLAFKQSQETSGQFKGYKFKPVRKKPHPKFGYFSRLRVLGDEGQNWPGGPFQDFNSLKASMDDTGRVKLVVAFNPENTTCKVVQMAEPDNGWVIDDVETLYDYTSKQGWRVCRLDGAKCENVIQKKNVYEGLLTYKGFVSYLQGGGDNSPAYLCFGRGFPPVVGGVDTIIPPAWPQEARGEATFIENPVIVAAVDLAFHGKDTAQMAVGRWGLAAGWEDHMRQRHTFKDRLNITISKPRYVLQIDQIFPLSKHEDPVTMAEEIISRCKTMKIKPEWVALDKTSIGLGTYAHLAKVWGDVLGIQWNEKATEAKMVAEDTEGADKQCDGVMSEMWWAFRRWIDPKVRAILINPIIPPQPIHTQLTSRRFKNGKRGVKVEPKDEYKARNQNSPDEADALVMLVHLIRMRGKVLPGTVEEQRPMRAPDGSDQIKFQRVKEFETADVHDSITEDGGSSDSLEP